MEFIGTLIGILLVVPLGMMAGRKAQRAMWRLDQPYSERVKAAGEWKGLPL